MKKLKPIPGFEGYLSISKDGGVYSHERKVLNRFGTYSKKPGRWLNPRPNNMNGEYAFRTSIDGQHYDFVLAHTVATAWIPNPKKYPCVYHKDSNKANNAVSNLVWGDRFMVSHNAFINGCIPLGENSCKSKLTNKDIISIRNLYANGTLRKTLAEMYNVNPSTITSITQKHTWRHI
jgi:hypothetical protein